MKILSLRFENLNALYGRWAIDFTHPDYEADGIFAITGPTGAGKTTILDAICLALYGRTPRLPRINRSSNEIMSRQRSQCFAEVVFETQAGQFLCHWSQHRARHQLTGELQAPRHELSDARSGTIIETGLRAVALAVEALTGLDYERFTRSVLLAQGAFAAFLHAGADERAPLLEQITGTELYARLSVAVHEQSRLMGVQRDERQRLYEAIQVLPLAEEQSLRQQLRMRQQQVQQLEAEMADTAAAVNWRHGLQKLATELAQAKKELECAQLAQQAFVVQQERLDWARRCSEYESDYVRWHAAQEQERRYAQQAQEVQAQLPTLQQHYQEALELARQRQQELKQAQDEYSNRQRLWQKVQRLDERLIDRRQWLDEAQSACQRQREQLQKAQAEQAQVGEELTALQRKYEAAQKYQEAHQADAWLEQGLEVVLAHLSQRAEQFTVWQEQQELVQQQQGDTRQWLRQQQAQQDRQTKQQAQLTALTQQLAVLCQQRTQVLEAQTPTYWRTLLREVQEQVHLRRLVASLDEQRQYLQSGQPCPLCGSKAHPYVQHGLPTLDHYEERQATIQSRLMRVDALTQQIEAWEQQVQQQREVLHQGTQKLLNLAHQVEQSRAREQAAQQLQQQAWQRLQKLEQQINQQLAPLGVQLETEMQSAALMHKLRARHQAWRDNQAKQQQLRQQLVQQQAELQRLQSLCCSYQEELAAQTAQHAKRQEEFAALQAHRHELFGSQDPQAEQRRYLVRLQQMEVQHQQLQQQALEAERAYTQQMAAARTLHAQHAEQQQRAQAAEQQLVQLIRPAGFADITVFEQKRLSLVERQQLEAQSTALYQALIQAQATYTERAQRLAQERAHALSALELPELEKQLQALQQQHTQLQSQGAQEQHQIEANEQAKRQRQAHYQAVRQQEADYRRWRALHTLIGSADGKKYRNFAQGLSFAQLVYYANQQMQAMSDRYLLLQGVEPLSLEVIDNYQGGVVRSTQNLSGGESFIVSLALALGLSKMASQNVRLDSLFLDEGFGTLDDEALGLALDTLASLRQESKLIGVISHVPALKERISTQIQVFSSRRGQSQLQGPGCRQE